ECPGAGWAPRRRVRAAPSGRTRRSARKGARGSWTAAPRSCFLFAPSRRRSCPPVLRNRSHAQRSMAVVLRLRRTGRKNLPCFRIIATDSRFPRDGRLLETLGLYDPLRKAPQTRVQIALERTQRWIAAGAKPSDIVASILRQRGIAARPQKPPDRGARTGKTKVRARRDARSAER